MRLATHRVSSVSNKSQLAYRLQRLEANQKEDDDFQRQLAQVLSRVDISRNRNSLLVEETPPSDEAPADLPAQAQPSAPDDGMESEKSRGE